MADVKSNLNIQVDVGLLNDWNIFNLNGVEGGINAYTNIYVEVAIDGSKYVENTDATIKHAANSPYKELESILPVIADEEGTTDLNTTGYGKGLRLILNGYYPMTGEALEEKDLWQAENNYKNYVNAFDVTFADLLRDEDNNEGESRVKVYENNILDKYYSYVQLPVSLLGMHYIKRTLRDIVGDRYILANVDLLHFSKYYNVFTYSPSPIPTLRPLIYDTESLGKYGMALYNADPLKPEEYNVYIKHLLMLSMDANDSWEEIGFSHTVYRENEECYSTDYETNHWRNGRYISHGMTMFKITPDTGSPHVLEGKEEEFKKFMPTGFSAMGTWNNCEEGTVFGPEEGPYSYNEKTLPLTYTSIFNTTGGTTKYNFYGLEDNGQSKVRLTFIYYGDLQNNFRIFNNYFYVNANKRSGSDEYLDITQNISYNSNIADKMPKTLGIALASVLANIYVYSTLTAKATDIPYILDCVYLNSNYTLYTKDIIYKAYVSKNTDNTDLLIFKGYKFRDYITAVKAAAAIVYRDPLGKINVNNRVNSTEAYNSSDKNITPNIDGCIKNVPIQLKIDYLEPNIESVGQSDNITRVFRIDGTHKDVYGWIPEDTKLYQLDVTDDGKYTINTLGLSFTIHYIKEPFTVLDDETIVAEFDDKVTPELNGYLNKIFGYDGETLTFKKTSASEGISKYYAAQARTDPSGWLEGSYHTYVTLKYIPRQDVLIPHAKMM